MNVGYLSLLFPLLILYLFLAFQNDFLDVSISPLGRLISIFLILYYTFINKYLGFLVCLIIILYYQLDLVEDYSRFLNVSILTPLYKNEKNSFKEVYMRT